MANPLQALRLEELRERTSTKWRRYPADVLPLWVAEMDVPLAEPLVDAVTDAMRRGDTGYADHATYAEAMAAFAANRWGWTFDLADSALVPDVMLGIVEVLKLVSSGGDAVVVNSPVYTPFYQFVGNLGRRVVESPLTPGHRIDFKDLEATFARERPAAYLLCSPHNPTGTVHTREELEAVGRLAGEYDVRVVVDEIHAPLVYPDAIHVPYLSLPTSQDAFALLSASKGWNLAGLKAALAVAGEAATTELRAMPEEVSHGASHVGVIAHRAALLSCAGWLDDLLAGLDENRHLLASLLEEYLPEVGYRLPEATYLAWLDCRPIGLEDDPAEVFLQRGQVAVVPGPSFGTGGTGHVRLNLATSREVLEEAVRRMASAVSRDEEQSQAAAGLAGRSRGVRMRRGR
ncbi:MAG: Cystathionine beta-lyase, type II [uncultured Nocardioidaceae bacterium]|uniref:cysteine-S-conjugate beta-lyase n=1 Tax=uncultured Nocardioidaceae bacterium TaxID=253824 RepID=A0A6J4LSC9_9ACTN|nr:MAG: Cystathionine beta-lyase, type II [uncultured Nocardioidaceae bacterium]